MPKPEPARLLREIQSDAIKLRMRIWRHVPDKDVAVEIRNKLWALIDEAFRRGVEYAEEEQREKGNA